MGKFRTLKTTRRTLLGPKVPSGLNAVFQETCVDVESEHTGPRNTSILPRIKFDESQDT